MRGPGELGLTFFDLDLRWGVPAKDANGETANTSKYCRQWIDRVEPVFDFVLEASPTSACGHTSKG